MKKELQAGISLVAAVSITALMGVSALAANNPNNNGTDHFGPFASTSTDGGSCGVPWANDTFNRFFTVHPNADGTFTVREEFKDGAFTTIGSMSPGVCETSNHHGTVVQSGVVGAFQGFLAGTAVSPTPYNPNGCSAIGADCSTTIGFITAVFGPGAQFSCVTGFAACDFNFEYHSSDQSLRYQHWQDKSDNHGGEQFIGDIANQ